MMESAAPVAIKAAEESTKWLGAAVADPTKGMFKTG